MQTSSGGSGGIDILLVEDSPGDARLIQEAMRDARISNRITRVNDGAAALAYLRKEGEYAEVRRPDLVLLDLGLPKVSGREVLAAVKEDPALKSIPIIVLTSSTLDEDVAEVYRLHGNCYVSKPVDIDQFMRVVRTIEDFWLTIVHLPRR